MSVYPEGVRVVRDAVISDCGQYRYRLTRHWGLPSNLFLSFIMLNPSTADARDDDNTIRRCVGFARAHGYDGIAVWNLYAYRATKPPEVWRAAKAGVDVVGPDNDRRLRSVLRWAHCVDRPVVAAWGANARDDRVREVLAMPHALDVLHHLGLTEKGVPRHPLMLRGDAPLTQLSCKERG